MHRTTPTRKIYSAQDVNSAEVEKHCNRKKEPREGLLTKSWCIYQYKGLLCRSWNLHCLNIYGDNNLIISAFSCWTVYISSYKSSLYVLNYITFCYVHDLLMFLTRRILWGYDQHLFTISLNIPYTVLVKGRNSVNWTPTQCSSITGQISIYAITMYVRTYVRTYVSIHLSKNTIVERSRREVAKLS